MKCCKNLNNNNNMKAGTASLKKVKDVGDYHMEIKLNNAINVI